MINAKWSDRAYSFLILIQEVINALLFGFSPILPGWCKWLWSPSCKFQQQSVNISSVSLHTKHAGMQLNQETIEQHNTFFGANCVVVTRRKATSKCSMKPPPPFFICNLESFPSQKNWSYCALRKITHKSNSESKKKSMLRFVKTKIRFNN